MSSEKEPNREQSSNPHHHPVDVDLEDRHEPDKSQTPVRHNDPALTKLTPLKKRPSFWEIGAAPERTLSLNVANNDGVPAEPASSEMIIGWQKNRKRGSGKKALAKEGAEDEEIEELFNSGKKKKKSGTIPAEIASHVERVMAELKVAAEEDAKLNRERNPAASKLKKLNFLIHNLSNKNLHQEFLDHGVLNLLKTWLEPLPDGSLPSIDIRKAISKILTELPIDLQESERREQMKSTSLGRIIKFLYEHEDETISNIKLAKNLLKKWSSQLFDKSKNIEDTRNVDDESVPLRRPAVKKPPDKGATKKSIQVDHDSDEFSWEPKSCQSSSRNRAVLPKLVPMDSVVQPQPQINPDAGSACNEQNARDSPRQRLEKKLKQMKKWNKKQLQATKVSVVGRGMDNFV